MLTSAPKKVDPLLAIQRP